MSLKIRFCLGLTSSSILISALTGVYLVGRDRDKELDLWKTSFSEPFL